MEEGEGEQAAEAVAGSDIVYFTAGLPANTVQWERQFPTMLRNALGVDEGGSGVPIDRAAYARSVEFWRTHANWR